MSEKKEYSYDELDDRAKTKAIFEMNQSIRVKLGMPTGAQMVNKTLIDCIILSLDTVFNKKGKPIYYSKKYIEATPELIKQIYNKCSDAIFRKKWAFKWINSNAKSYLDGKTSLNKIKGEIKTAVRLGVTKEDFEKIIEDFKSYRGSEKLQSVLEILYGPEIIF